MTLSVGIDETVDDEVDDEDQRRGEPADAASEPSKRKIRWTYLVAYGVLPGVVVLLAAAAGFLKWLSWWQSQEDIARVNSARAAADGTVAMLSYHPDTVQNDLDAAKSRLTGSFRDSYTALVDDVVAPAAIQKLISSVATVPAAGAVSTTKTHSVVLVYVNQTVTVGNDRKSVRPSRSCGRTAFGIATASASTSPGNSSGRSYLAITTFRSTPGSSIQKATASGNETSPSVNHPTTSSVFMNMLRATLPNKDT